MPVLLTIDANIFLRFFEFSSDSLEQLKKLSGAIEHGHIQLVVTEQVKREFEVRRGEVVKRSIKELDTKKAPDSFPRIVDPYDEYKELRATSEAFNKALSALIKKITADAQETNLAADLVLGKIFEKATNVPCSDIVISAAELRVKTGLPPGKKGLGDAITWEALVASSKISPGSELYFVTGDSDYVDPLAPTKISPVLRNEWEQRKKGTIVLYNSLGQFFAAHFPKIEIADEWEKLSAINELVYSGSFMSTHSAIAVLSQFSTFTTNETKKLVDALLHNMQIHWIAHDLDVAAFYQKLTADKQAIFEPNIWAELKKVYPVDTARG